MKIPDYSKKIKHPTYLEMQEEIERLKDLCNKYEEEHKTTFEEWKKAINIIKEVRELLSQEWYTVLRKGTIKQVLEILDKEI